MPKRYSSRSRSKSESRNRHRNRDRSRSRDRRKSREPSSSPRKHDKNRSRSWSLDSLGRKRRRETRGRSGGRPRERESRSKRRYRSRSRSTSREQTYLPRSSKDSPDEGLGAKNYRSQILNAGKNETKSGKEMTEVKTSDMNEEDAMKMLLGFSGFDSTKGKVVEDNDKSAASGYARMDPKREYRQYMNRRGGFNRPLDN